MRHFIHIVEISGFMRYNNVVYVNVFLKVGT